MFKATSKKREFAEQLLARMTPSELRLWAELSKVTYGPKSRTVCSWRPQVVIKGWIVDFYNDHMLTAIEVDGQVHNQAEQQAKDAIKDSVLSHFGIKVIRLTNAEVNKRAAALVDKIMLTAR